MRILSLFRGPILLHAGFVLLLPACTHTTHFYDPPDASKNYSPTTVRNYENFMLEKELSQARTASLMCSVVGGIGLVAGLTTIGKVFENGASLLPLSAGVGGVTCALWYKFIAERAEVYLEGAGVKIMF
jgi:hypothetical protein